MNKAQLEDGQSIDYFPQKIAEGTMKDVYLSQNRELVLCFYKYLANQPTQHQLQRLRKIVRELNPTLVPQTNAHYWQHLFCWPTGIIQKPRLGLIAPIYPKPYFFSSGRWQGSEKKSRWFISPKLRHYLPTEEQGPWINFFKISILLARAVSRLHLAGLAHSDLSSNNVLVDPRTGQMLIIDLDSLVVPHFFPPEVEGTPGYLAPEVLATSHLSTANPAKNLPNIRTDQHALAVLLYELLLNRHPLKGPKIHSAHSAAEDEHLGMGEQALFIEHPTDFSNRPLELQPPMTALGPILTQLFYQAFVTGLHLPDERPSAYQWERGLIQTWNLLYPCPNPSCTSQWFIVLPESQPITCPFCQTPLLKPFPLLSIGSQKRRWLPSEQLAIYDGQGLFKWHIFDNIFPGPNVDRTLQAYGVFHQGKWLLINRALTSLTGDDGKRVGINQALELNAGTTIHFSQEPHGCIAKVAII